MRLVGAKLAGRFMSVKLLSDSMVAIYVPAKLVQQNDEREASIRLMSPVVESSVRGCVDIADIRPASC